MKSTIWQRRLQKSRTKRRQNINNNNWKENVCDNYYRYFPTDLPKDAFGFCEKILLCLLLFPARSRGEDYRLLADDEEGGCEIVSRDLSQLFLNLKERGDIFPSSLKGSARARREGVHSFILLPLLERADLSSGITALTTRCGIFFHRAHLLLLLLLNRINNDPPLAL